MSDYFNHIYDDTYHDMLRYVISKCNDLSYVQDVMQDIYANLYKTINKKGTNYIDNYKAFLIKLAKRELYKYYHFKRKESNHFDHGIDNNIEDVVDDKHFDVDEEAFNNITTERIWQEIAKESLINQKIMVLYYLEDATIKEIADILELNENTIKSKLYRALSKLREKFGDKNE